MATETLHPETDRAIEDQKFDIRMADHMPAVMETNRLGQDCREVIAHKLFNRKAGLQQHVAADFGQRPGMARRKLNLVELMV